MHLIVLPGNSKEFNEQWLHDSAKAYKDLFDSVTEHYYDHWKTGDANANIEAEVAKLEEEAGKLNGDYVILAKSVGTLITVEAVNKEKVEPKKCVFVGSPWNSIQNELDNYKIPTLFIQQTDDKFFKYEELEEVINGNKVTDYKLIEIPGSNHAYDNYDEIKSWIKDFLKS